VTSPSAQPFQVRLPEFEGPLDLLLQLVERNSLPILDVSLALVTEEYVRRVERLEAPPEETSHFLTVASRLLLLKSRRLAPRPEPEPYDPTPDDLAAQLREYQRFKRAAAMLRDLEGRSSYPQLVPPPQPARSTATAALPPAALHRALHRTLRRLERDLPAGELPPRERLRLADAAAAAESIMRAEGSVGLDRLAGPDAGRYEIVVAFLTVLDLVRRRRARAVQEGAFGPVLLYPLEIEAPE